MTDRRDNGPTAPRRLGRRRSRLYWTIAILVAVAVAGTAMGVSVYRSSRPDAYRTGEDLAEITRRLELKIPEGAPEPAFEDVTEQAGLGGFRSFVGERTSQLPEDMGSGAAWGDFDDDGDDDLFLVSAGGPLNRPADELERSRLYVNRGDGTFSESKHFPETRIHGMGAAWGDYDADGRLDLVVTGYDALRLYHNSGDGFEPVPFVDDPTGYWAGVSWADFDRDGDLDLYICGYVEYVPDNDATRKTSQQYGRAVPYTLNPASFEPARNLLLRNDGRGGFENVAGTLGVDNPAGRSLGALWYDFDADGWLDLYVANDISDNALFLNRRGSFEDTSHEAWVADYRGAMGLTAGDWDRDGDDDLFVTHWVAQENALYDSLLNDLTGEKRLRFMDVADRQGLGQIALQVVGWGTEFVDLDADGWLDLAVANGSTFETEQAPKRLRSQAAFLFWNRRGEAFHDLAQLNGSLSAPRVSRGLAVSDYDLDGDMDLLIVDLDGGVRLLANGMQSGSWIQIRLRGDQDRPVVEGTQVRATLPGTTLRRAVSSVSYLSQSSRTLHFGLAEAGQVERVEIRWPDGQLQVHENLASNTRWELTRGNPAPQRLFGSEKSSAPVTERERVTEFWRRQRAAMQAMKVDGDLETAIELFRGALELNPAHEDSLYYLGNCLTASGDVDGGLERLDELRRLNPMSHRALKGWGILRATTARSPAEMQEAVDSLERALAINPEETGALQALAEVELMRGNSSTAQQRLEWVIRANPRASGGLFFLAYVAWKEENRPRATELLQRAVEARGEDWKPEGSVAEGDVRWRMHRDTTPLLEFIETWDGTTDPEVAFRPLEAHLERRVVPH